jgi:hypothetical protein
MMETQENTLRYKSKESGTKTNDLNADTILNGFKLLEQGQSDRNIK